jgi:hypothetical protein
MMVVATVAALLRFGCRRQRRLCSTGRFGLQPLADDAERAARGRLAAPTNNLEQEEVRGESVAIQGSGQCRYSIELFKPGGEGAGIEEILDRHADLKIARSIYRTRVEQYPGRLNLRSSALFVRAAYLSHLRA